MDVSTGLGWGIIPIPTAEGVQLGGRLKPKTCLLISGGEGEMCFGII
jgi:hypothetical protein